MNPILHFLGIVKKNVIGIYRKVLYTPDTVI